jgi:hypothetical protein
MFDEQTGIDFPFFQNQLEDMFGIPDETGPFAQGYLRRLDLSEFADALGHVVNLSHGGGVRDEDRGYFGFYGNFVLLEPLKKALKALIEKGLAQQLQTFDGCFNIRSMRSNATTPSVHSWALAIDWNAATNPFSRGRLITDLSDEFILCFLQAGFEWGGLWKSCKDPMHFQLPWTKDWRGITGGPIPYQI